MSTDHVEADPVHDAARSDAHGPTPAPASLIVQPVLEVGASNDPHEREADQVADLVVRAMRSRGPAPVRTSRVAPSQMARRSASRSDGFAAPPDVEHRIRRSAGRGGRPVPSDFADGVEAVTGVDVSATRIHTGAEADHLARSIDARAFATGGDVFFKRGELDTSSGEGKRVLAHELAHVAQQGGAAGTAQRIQRGPIRRLDDQERNDLFTRASSLDYDLLTMLAERSGLVGRLFSMSGKFGKGGGVELEGTRQMILTSTKKTSDIASLVDKAISTGDLGPLRKKLHKSKQRSSRDVYTMIEQCRGIATAYYRAEQQNAGADMTSLVGDAKTYDTGGDGRHDNRLQHQEKRRFRSSRTVSHDLEGVMQKVITVADMDLRNTHGPHVGPLDPQAKGAPARAHIGVVGAGPVGLVAAIESRMQGANVTLFEGRSDEYSRRQVLVLDRSTIQRFAGLGIKAELLDPDKGKGNGQNRQVAVKYIEKALRDRASELGVTIRTNMRLVTAKGGSGDTKATFQKGADKKATESVRLDLLVVAAGAGVARADKYTGMVLADELGISYDVTETKDYAVVGLFDPSDKGSLSRFGGGDKRRWAYRFNTPKVAYVLQQIPQSLYDDFRGPGGDKKMRDYIETVAKEHFEMSDAKFAPDRNSKDQRTPNVGMFPIEIQQAKSFVNESLRTLVIGDSAGTPHPHTGSGLNTGMREIDALGDVVASVQTEAAMKLAQERDDESDDKGKGKKEDEDEKPEVVKSALSKYNQEIKVLTDFMVNKALKTLAGEHRKYLNEAIAAIEKDFGSRLAGDFRFGLRVDSIKETVKSVTAGDSDWSYDMQLSYLMDAHDELNRIRAQLES